jgi:hypothetical protein
MSLNEIPNQLPITAPHWIKNDKFIVKLFFFQKCENLCKIANNNKLTSRTSFLSPERRLISIRISIAGMQSDDSDESFMNASTSFRHFSGNSIFSRMLLNLSKKFANKKTSIP